jgi:hypothetical protein
MGQSQAQFASCSPVKYGRYTRYVPWTYRSKTLKALAAAEDKFGRPVYIIEVAEEFRRTTWLP